MFFYPPPQSTKQFTIVEITPRTASLFVARWHSHLPRIHPSAIYRNRLYICLAAIFNQVDMWAVAVWTSPVARHLDDGYTLELRRMAIAENAPRNTGSWFLGAMIPVIKSKFPQVKKLISYSASFKAGTIYKAANWKQSGITPHKEWNNRKRKRRKAQIKCEKLRWEKDI